MRRGTIIRIIADAPAKGQDSIAGWIGKEMAVKVVHDDGSVSVDDNGGLSVIQPAEFEVVGATQPKRVRKP